MCKSPFSFPSVKKVNYYYLILSGKKCLSCQTQKEASRVSVFTTAWIVQYLTNKGNWFCERYGIWIYNSWVLLLVSCEDKFYVKIKFGSGAYSPIYNYLHPFQFDRHWKVKKPYTIQLLLCGPVATVTEVKYEQMTF